MPKTRHRALRRLVRQLLQGFAERQKNRIQRRAHLNAIHARYVRRKRAMAKGAAA